MKINALLDVNLVAHETEDEVAVLLELEAPPAVADEARPQASFQVVLDRSGSMDGAPLEGAKQALVALVRRLEPTDNFGLVTFENEAQVVVPAGPLTDKEATIERIMAVRTGGMTDLGAGVLRGLRELRRVVGESGGTVLVVSDGHVNSGIKSADEFATLAAKAYAEGIVTSTLGYGRGYDETLLAAIARSGNGNHVFADNPDAAGAAIAGEVDGLLSKTVQGAALTIRFEPAVEMLRLYNDLPAQQIGDGTVMVELGDLFAAESRKLLLKFRVPALASLGLAHIATLELAYVELPALVEQTVSLPINVNVVPGDEAAARVPHPTVHSEVLFQEAQDAKRQASEAFERGDVQEGRKHLRETKHQLGLALEGAPADVASGIRADLDEVDGLDVSVQAMGSAYASKMSRESYHRGNRKRGRTPRPDAS
ncbi:VWA domain-containing protein [Nocardioides sp. JQ2195]|uniref:vWA domain-containing protein n=1 Tax=Nocardioides sp. JQ2195 TaxID=2592334 RepID=UPI00143E11B4|nr:VWA domain-containing protein [Nocardioides sp. JQ2195]QIX27256.1 VWA domain-containing protein [Nocardioides sp. JQ2195]